MDDEDDTSEDERSPDAELPKKLQAPVILPRRRFAGACNVETIKDGTHKSSYLFQ